MKQNTASCSTFETCCQWATEEPISRKSDPRWFGREGASQKFGLPNVGALLLDVTVIHYHILFSTMKEMRENGFQTLSSQTREMAESLTVSEDFSIKRVTRKNFWIKGRRWIYTRSCGTIPSWDIPLIKLRTYTPFLWHLQI